MPIKSQTDIDPTEYISKIDTKATLRTAKRVYPILQKYFRAQILGTENLPKVPFVGVGNHGGFGWVPDSVLWMAYYHAHHVQPPLLALAHDISQRLRFTVTPFLHKMGVVPARYSIGKAALAAGFAVQVYPGGDLDANRPIWQTNKITFFNHTGYIRLALEAGVPIVPIVAIGGAETQFILWDGAPLAELLQLDKFLRLNSLPLSYRIGKGFGFSLGPRQLPLPAQITISVLPPRHFEGFSPNDAQDLELVRALDNEICEQMQRELNRLAQNRIPIIGKIKK